MGWTAWVGATIFEVGSVCGMWEAWNRDDVADFGWGVERALKGKHGRTQETVINGKENIDKENGVGEDAPEKSPVNKPQKQWKWWSSDGKYWREIGFLAAFAQFCAASIFWISGYVF